MKNKNKYKLAICLALAGCIILPNGNTNSNLYDTYLSEASGLEKKNIEVVKKITKSDNFLQSSELSLQNSVASVTGVTINDKKLKMAKYFNTDSYAYAKSQKLLTVPILKTGDKLTIETNIGTETIVVKGNNTFEREKPLVEKKEEKSTETSEKKDEKLKDTKEDKEIKTPGKEEKDKSENEKSEKSREESGKQTQLVGNTKKEEKNNVELVEKLTSDTFQGFTKITLKNSGNSIKKVLKNDKELKKDKYVRSDKYSYSDRHKELTVPILKNGDKLTIETDQGTETIVVKENNKFERKKPLVEKKEEKNTKTGEEKDEKSKETKENKEIKTPGKAEKDKSENEKSEKSGEESGKQTQLVGNTKKEDKNNVELVTKISKNGFSNTTNIQLKNNVNSIKKVLKNGQEMSDGSPTFQPNAYNYIDADKRLTTNELKPGDKLTIETDQGTDTIRVTNHNEFTRQLDPVSSEKNQVPVEKEKIQKPDPKKDKKEPEFKKVEDEKGEENKKNDSIKISYKKEGAGVFADCFLEISDKDISKEQIKYKRNGKDGAKRGAKNSLDRDEAYYVDSGNRRIYIKELKDKENIVLTIGNNEYKFRAVSKNGNVSLENMEKDSKESELEVKIEGEFEAAILDQKKYDGISGATGSVSQNTNSNVQVKIKDQQISEDWVNIQDYKGYNDFSKSEVKIEPQDSGMTAHFSKRTGKITLSGTPSKVGSYKIKVILRANGAKEIASNELPFEIYTNKGYLEDYLKEDKFKKHDNGNNMKWDQSPWNIPNIAKNKEFTVSPKLNTWFGSHQSGTYGVLGNGINKADEKLIVGSGTNLTLANMKVLSSVDIIVKDGGHLNIHDSSIYGKIYVKDGGSLTINYDEHNKKFITGSSIQGQIVLEKGATLKNSLIYSNTNFLTDNEKANKNVDPVVLVTGDAKIEGKVHIRGDESPTGEDPNTKKLYTGQKALGIKNAKLTIEEGGVLGAYGGGDGTKATTSFGGDAIILDDGVIDGEGTLISHGGSSYSHKAGDAIVGKGLLDVRKVLLQGGNVYGNKASDIGLAYTDDIKIGENTFGSALEGKNLPYVSDNDSTIYWRRSDNSPREELLESLIKNNKITNTKKQNLTNEERKPSVVANKENNPKDESKDEETKSPIEKETKLIDRISKDFMGSTTEIYLKENAGKITKILKNDKEIKAGYPSVLGNGDVYNYNIGDNKIITNKLEEGTILTIKTDKGEETIVIKSDNTFEKKQKDKSSRESEDKKNQTQLVGSTKKEEKNNVELVERLTPNTVDGSTQIILKKSGINIKRVLKNDKELKKDKYVGPGKYAYYDKYKQLTVPILNNGDKLTIETDKGTQTIVIKSNNEFENVPNPVEKKGEKNTETSGNKGEKSKDTKKEKGIKSPENSPKGTPENEKSEKSGEESEKQTPTKPSANESSKKSNETPNSSNVDLKKIIDTKDMVEMKIEACKYLLSLAPKAVEKNRAKIEAIIKDAEVALEKANAYLKNHDSSAYNFENNKIAEMIRKNKIKQKACEYLLEYGVIKKEEHKVFLIEAINKSREVIRKAENYLK